MAELAESMNLFFCSCYSGEYLGGVRDGGRAGVRRVLVQVVRAGVHGVLDGGQAGARHVHVVRAGVHAGGHHG